MLAGKHPLSWTSKNATDIGVPQWAQQAAVNPSSELMCIAYQRSGTPPCSADVNKPLKTVCLPAQSMFF